MVKPLPNLVHAENIDSILVVRLKALGDIVLSLPVVRALRLRFQNAWIGYLCRERFAEALAGDTGLTEVLTMPEGITGQLGLIGRLRRKKLDFVLDLLSSPRSAILTYSTGAGLRVGMNVGRHNWCYHSVLPRIVVRNGMRVKCYTLESNRGIVRMLGLDFPGAAEDAAKTAVGFPAAALEAAWAGRYIEELGCPQSKLVGLAPGATYHSKSWPEENFIALAGRLVHELGLTPVILWGPGEERIAEAIADRVPGVVKAPPTGIARLGALIARLALLVTLDTGPKHLAVVQGIPTVTLFGPTDPCIWDPMTDRHRVLYRDMPCSPCRIEDCRPNRCLADISPGEVLETVADMLGLLHT